jgi:uncharacterized protein YjbJ (UPF0337 family)
VTSIEGTLAHDVLYIRQEVLMGAFKEQVKGARQQVKGKVKEATGRAVGNPRLEVEGNLEKNVGKVRQSVARPMEALKGAAQQAKGTVKRGMGEAIGSPDIAGEGEAERVAGKIRRKLNE